jgi:hypothetical protein
LELQQEILHRGVAVQAAAARHVSEIISPNSALGNAVSEAGVIQLLFDMHLLSCALTDAAGPNAIAPSAGDATAPVLKAAEAARADHRALEQQLVNKLDPIDWATYEKYLKGLVRESLARKSLLLGLLVAAGPAQEVAPLSLSFCACSCSCLNAFTFPFPVVLAPCISECACLLVLNQIQIQIQSIAMLKIGVNFKRW